MRRALPNESTQMKIERVGGMDLDRVRIFHSPLLERLTLTRPAPVAALWLTIIFALFGSALSETSWSTGTGLVCAGAGFCAWTLFEYLMHRFLFHFRAKSAGGQHSVFVMHGAHHKQPEDRLRALMPPFVSLPLGAFLFGLAALALERPWLEASFGGFLTGYLVFDLIHWACHHGQLPTALGRALKRYHLRHHFDHRSGNFGVSSPIWDWLFGTRFPK